MADAETERYRLFDAVADLLAEMSAAHPVVLVLDDIHWADKPSLVLLRHLLALGDADAPARALHLPRHRPRPQPPALRRARRLPAPARRRAARPARPRRRRGHRLHGDRPPATTSSSRARPRRGRCTPRPRATRSSSARCCATSPRPARSSSDDGRWTTPDVSMGDFGIPEGIREVVGRRLSRLSDAVNQALAVAAVIGPVFDLVDHRRRRRPGGDELFDALDEATAVGLIREVPGAVGRYAFAHALVRSALYEELTTNRRVRMHWRIGEVIESRYASKLDAHLDELAFHFSEGALAGDPMKAVGYARRAGERAVDELAFESRPRALRARARFTGAGRPRRAARGAICCSRGPSPEAPWRRTPPRAPCSMRPRSRDRRRRRAPRPRRAGARGDTSAASRAATSTTSSSRSSRRRSPRSAPTSPTAPACCRPSRSSCSSDPTTPRRIELATRPSLSPARPATRRARVRAPAELGVGRLHAAVAPDFAAAQRGGGGRGNRDRSTPTSCATRATSRLERGDRRRPRRRRPPVRGVRPPRRPDAPAPRP